MSDNQPKKIFAMLEKNIRLKAKEKNMSIAEIIREIEMSEAGFYRMLENESIKVKTLIKISEVLDTPLTMFFQEPGTTSTYEVTTEISTFGEPDSTKYRSTIEHQDRIIKMLEEQVRDKEYIIELYREQKRDNK
jgi:transcriptional regulator with XRE-family HTH domain